MYSRFYYLQSFIYYNFIFIMLLTFLALIVFYYSRSLLKIQNNRLFNYIEYIRSFILTALAISFFVHILSLYLFLIYSSKHVNYYLTFIPLIYNHNEYGYYFNYFYFSIDFFGLILLLLAYLVGFISIYVLDTRLYEKNLKYLFSFTIFVLIVYLYTTTSNVLLLFMYYELLLLPSFLFVYYTSSSRRAVQASVYFVVWTQIGSLIVLFTIGYIIKITNSVDLNIVRSFIFSTEESYFIYTLLFLGFGVKVPIWPFHYWLTKTHVEAPSGFSIYLSGFLVKTAIYGFYKITTAISAYISTTFFITLCIMGIVDSSLKMWGQTDLKKLVAYGTIQEMNIIYLTFCWGDSTLIGAGILFCVTHAFLSAMMFYLVDCIYRRFHTRSFVEINGILHINPNLAISILFMLIFFAGLPGTLKFTVEFYIFSAIMSVSYVICFFIIFIANVVGLVGFSKCWFNSVFGLHKKWLVNSIVDLSLKEIYVLFICFFYLIIFSFLPAFII